MASATTAASAPSGTVGTGGYGPLYYALTFEIMFKYDHDTVFFAHCYPFTYTD